MFGDYLKENIAKLTTADNTKNKTGFYEILKDIAVEDICMVYPSKVDSNKAIEIYRTILKKNEEKLPGFIKETYSCNKQKKYEVSARNIFSSNAFHTTGIANNDKIEAYKTSNSEGGQKTVFKKKG